LSQQIASEAIAAQRSHKVELPQFHQSDAGMIQNLLELPCGGVGLIASKANSVRANHWHRTDWHYLYVVSGSFVHFFRPVGSNKRPKRMTVKSGEMLYTPPNEEHALWFREPTVMVSMSRLSRTHDVHEDDVVRLETPLVGPQ
jgi:hypothetical protein